MLDANKSAEVTGRKSERLRPVDPLRRRLDALALEHASDGLSLRRPPRQTKAASQPAPQLELDELKRRSREEMLRALSGVEV